MNVGDYLLATIERIAKRLILAREPLCLTGEVTAVKPLKIRVKNYELSEEHLVLDVRCTEQWIKIPKDGANEHTHGMEEALVNYTATGNMGAPVIFVPQGMDPFVPNPNYDSNKERTDDDTNKGTGTNPYWKLNPAIPDPTTLQVRHAHGIHNALPEICLWRELRVGDKVRIIRLEGGAIHWVTGRIEDNIANDSSEDGGKYGTT